MTLSLCVKHKHGRLFVQIRQLRQPTPIGYRPADDALLWQGQVAGGAQQGVGVQRGHSVGQQGVIAVRGFDKDLAFVAALRILLNGF